MGTQLPPEKKEQPHPTFGPMSFVAKRLHGWIKMPLGTEVNFGSGDVVLDAVGAPPKRGTYSPQFSVHVCCGQTAGWIRRHLVRN